MTVLRFPPDALTVYALAGLDTLYDYVSTRGLAYGIYLCPRCEGTPTRERPSAFLPGKSCPACLGYGKVAYLARGIQVGSGAIKEAREA